MSDDLNAPATAEQLAAFEFVPLASEEAEAMHRDFSKKPWAAECAEHGIALRIAYVLMTQTKAKLVDGTEAMEREYSGDGAGPTADWLETLRHSRERLRQLAKILETAEFRQLSAGAVIELRLEGGADIDRDRLALGDSENAATDLPALRERVAAIVAEFNVPLPAGDDGIFEAARRVDVIQERFRPLSKVVEMLGAWDGRGPKMGREFTTACQIEAAEIIPQRDGLTNPLFHHLERHAEPQTLAAAAALLRHGLTNGVPIDPDDGMIENVLALVEREIAAKGAA
jgi:hypothetical protein